MRNIELHMSAIGCQDCKEITYVFFRNDKDFEEYKCPFCGWKMWEWLKEQQEKEKVEEDESISSIESVTSNIQDEGEGEDPSTECEQCGAEEISSDNA